MEFFSSIYLTILNLIMNLLTVFGADTSAVQELIDNFKSLEEKEETETV